MLYSHGMTETHLLWGVEIEKREEHRLFLPINQIVDLKSKPKSSPDNEYSKACLFFPLNCHYWSRQPCGLEGFLTFSLSLHKFITFLTTNPIFFPNLHPLE